MICIISLTQVEERLVWVIVMVFALLLSGCAVFVDLCDYNNPTVFQCGYFRKYLIERARDRELQEREEGIWPAMREEDLARPAPAPDCASASDPACW